MDSTCYTRWTSGYGNTMEYLDLNTDFSLNGNLTSQLNSTSHSSLKTGQPTLFYTLCWRVNAECSAMESLLLCQDLLVAGNLTFPSLTSCSVQLRSTLWLAGAVPRGGKLSTLWTKRGQSHLEVEGRTVSWWHLDRTLWPFSLGMVLEWWKICGVQTLSSARDTWLYYNIWFRFRPCLCLQLTKAWTSKH